MSAISLGVTSGKSWANQVLSPGALHECTDGLQSCGYSRIRFREAVLVHAPYVGKKSTERGWKYTHQVAQKRQCGQTPADVSVKVLHE